MARKKRLKLGDTVTHKVIDRDGNESQIKSKVIGLPGQPKKLSEVTGPAAKAATKKTGTKKSRKETAPSPAEETVEPAPAPAD
ncbi:hypothetical protein [Paremcibacter congregatus]|uniref:hypothetical protein n=1 Tax=Paremcibacter congregatus TaxID=2043170 RepID=UPI003A8FE196